MQDMIDSLEARGEIESGREDAYLSEFRTMMEGHAGHGADAKDLDTAFAQGMIMHHQMAVDMAQAALRYAQEEEVISFARGIIDLQEEEITRMQGFLDGNGDSGHHH